MDSLFENELIHGDASAKLADVPDESVHLVVTNFMEADAHKRPSELFEGGGES